MNEQQAVSIVRKLAQKFSSPTTYIHVLNIPTILDEPRESAIFIGSSVDDEDMVIIMEAGSMYEYEEVERMKHEENISTQVFN